MIDLLGRFPSLRIAVVGDVMVDQFVVGRIDRISPEAPVPVVRVTSDDYRLGGAANVAHNIRALGATARLVGLIGQDEAAGHLRRQLDAAGLTDAHLVVEADRPTTRKVRVVTPRNQQVARLDYEHDEEPPAAIVARLCEQVASAAEGAHVIVLSDYHKGVVTPRVIDAAVAASRTTGAPLLIDPKVPQPERYRGATLITPNHHEAEVMAATAIRTADDVRRAARIIHERSGANVLITWGERGMWLLWAADGSIEEERLPAAAREVADVTGAGDTVIATLALALGAGGRPLDAARLSNLTAGLVVARFGAAVVTIDELERALHAAES